MNTPSETPSETPIHSLIDTPAESARATQARIKAREAIRRSMERDAAKRRAIPPALKLAKNPSAENNSKKSPMVAAKGDDDLMSQPQQPSRKGPQTELQRRHSTSG